MSWECKTTIWLTVVSGKIRQLLRGPANEWPPALASILLPTPSGVPDCSTQLLHPDNILMQFILDAPHSCIWFQIWVVNRDPAIATLDLWLGRHRPRNNTT